MPRGIALLLIGCILVIVGIAWSVIIPFSNEDIAWKMTKRMNTIEAYEMYMERYQTHTNEAVIYREIAYKNWLISHPTLDNFALYFEIYSNNHNTFDTIKRVLYYKVLEENTFDSYLFYVNNVLNRNFKRSKEIERRAELVLWTDVQENRKWKKYLDYFPKGKHYKEVLLKYENDEWGKCRQATHTHPCNSFIQRFPRSNRIYLARQILDRIGWRDALRVNTKRGYEEYLRNNSSGKYRKNAKSKISDFVWDNIWQNACSNNSNLDFNKINSKYHSQLLGTWKFRTDHEFWYKKFNFLIDNKFIFDNGLYKYKSGFWVEKDGEIIVTYTRNYKCKSLKLKIISISKNNLKVECTLGECFYKEFNCTRMTM